MATDTPRFRWTRRNYRQARQLSRILHRQFELPQDPPWIVQRYWRLLARWPQRDDPLQLAREYRLLYWRDDIPF